MTPDSPNELIYLSPPPLSGMTYRLTAAIGKSEGGMWRVLAVGKQVLQHGFGNRAWQEVRNMVKIVNDDGEIRVVEWAGGAR